jgi:hypothetical protein
MMQKPWFKVFIWVISACMFFLVSCMIIATFCPGPSEQQIMAFMSGMMEAMRNSLMGYSMSIESDENLLQFISSTSAFTPVLIIVAILAGFYVRLFRRRK